MANCRLQPARLEIEAHAERSPARRLIQLLHVSRNGTEIESRDQDFLVSQIGDVQPLVDGNGNGVADSGESGYLRLTYAMIVGAGARIGSYENVATAVDQCDFCAISQAATAALEINSDPVFDLGTIIGKVFGSATYAFCPASTFKLPPAFLSVTPPSETPRYKPAGALVDCPNREASQIESQYTVV